MKELGLKKLVMQEVKRPVYPREKKGRFNGERTKFKDLIDFMNYT